MTLLAKSVPDKSMEVCPRAHPRCNPALVRTRRGQVTDKELHEALHVLRLSQPDICVEEALLRMKDDHPQWVIDTQRVREAMRALECIQPSLAGDTSPSSPSASINRKLHDRDSSYSMLSGLDSLQVGPLATPCSPRESVRALGGCGKM